MKILVFGAGAIGSLMIHALCRAGNDVTVVARSTYDDLRRRGVVIYHYFQKTHYDIVFSVLQGQQQNELLDTFAKLNTRRIVLVGNNTSSEEQERYILDHAVSPRKVLFGFQGSAGHREKGRTVCARLPVTELVIGGSHHSASDYDKKLISHIFRGSVIKPNYIDDMDAYYHYHMAEILPYAFICYKYDCDLKKVTGEDVVDIMSATKEAFDMLGSKGYPVMPPNEEKYYESGVKRKAMQTLYRIMSRTVLGELMISDHCKNARPEMTYLCGYFSSLRGEDDKMPVWDRIRTL